MSNLSALPISDLRNIFDLTAMIETGAEHGYGIKAGLSAGFEKIYSCEILKQNYDQVVNMFWDNHNVKVVYGASRNVLSSMLDNVKCDNCLFWLDAHLPNCHDRSREYTIEDILPVLDELRIIAEHDRCHDGDLIIIDDLCLLNESFRGQDFDLQRWTDNKGSRDIDLDNILELFEEHIWFREDTSDGCLIAIPFMSAKINKFGWKML
jgi:hypothetical protein